MTGGGRRSASGFAVVALLVAACATLVTLALRGGGGQASLADRTRAVASTVRCPVCRDLSVADSPSTLARQMREQIRRDLAAGATGDEVRNRFVASYGPSVLLRPPRSGIDGTVWLAPLVLAAVGAVGGGALLRRWRAVAVVDNAPDLSPARRRRIDRELAALRAEEHR
jgi:cytochrome c-type biogenesis protein CcmH